MNVNFTSDKQIYGFLNLIDSCKEDVILVCRNTKTGVVEVNFNLKSGFNKFLALDRLLQEHSDVEFYCRNSEDEALIMNRLFKENSN